MNRPKNCRFTSCLPRWPIAGLFCFSASIDHPSFAGLHLSAYVTTADGTSPSSIS